MRPPNQGDRWVLMSRGYRFVKAVVNKKCNVLSGNYQEENGIIWPASGESSQVVKRTCFE